MPAAVPQATERVGEVLRAPLDWSPLIIAAVAARGPSSSLCPSELARAHAPQCWREQMPAIRAAARQLALQGALEITQRGVVLDATQDWRGAIRLRQPRS